MNYYMSISYDGSKFYGFQRLKKQVSVQEKIESVLTKLNKGEVLIKGAGRTDRGVHALDQGVSFSLSQNIPPERLKNALNSYLHPYIKVNDVKIVDDDFHARFSVREKTYTYLINMGEYDPISNDYIYNYNKSLNVKSMILASKVLLGPHSYEAFTSGKRDNYDSIISSIKIKKKKNYLYITFTGKSFYRYMVRNLVGALILVGEGKINKSDLEDILNQKKARNYLTVPASGLYLMKVKY